MKKLRDCTSTWGLGWYHGFEWRMGWFLGSAQKKKVVELGLNDLKNALGFYLCLSVIVSIVMSCNNNDNSNANVIWKTWKSYSAVLCIYSTHMRWLYTAQYEALQSGSMSRLQHSSTCDWLEVIGNESAQTHRQDETELQQWAERSCVEVERADISQVSITMRVLCCVSLIIAYLHGFKKSGGVDLTGGDGDGTRISCEWLHP